MNNPFDQYEKIFCINLKEREDRWNQCVFNFNKYEIKNYERFNAYKISADHFDKKRLGQIGCAFSFYKCFEKIKTDKLQSILILEDDFNFTLDKEDLFKKINTCISELPNNWDSLYFGANLTDEYGINAIEKYSNNLYRLKSAHCLHSVSFSIKGIEKIFDILGYGKSGFDFLIANYENMDAFMAKTYQNQTNTLITNEILCNQTPSFSSIENAVFDYNQWINFNFNKFKSIL